MSVELVTNLGSLQVHLYTREAPRTCRNFVELSRHGYYDGVAIHRITPVLVQTGDPLGDGSGGESIYGHVFDDEITKRLSHNKRGTVSMANSGPNSNGSQFFITFEE
jgi:peptidyl-prolyl cis-trans isomerase-like 1